MNAVEIFEKLVAIDSTSEKSNYPIADFIANALDRPGVRIERIGPHDLPKTNLLVRLGPESAAPDGLVLSGHMDCVPARESGWNSDPFQLTDNGDHWTARGASDMKGFLALATDIAREIDPSSLRAPLVLLFTYDEEVGTLGANYFAKNHRAAPLPRSVIIGEPTSLRVVRLHKGHLKARITVRGRSAHSGYPHLGKNAIETGGRVIAALGELRSQLERERPAHHEHFGNVPFVAFNIGTVHGGTAINIIPDQCVVEVGARLLPGMEGEEMMERIRATVSAASGDATVELLNESPPLLVDTDAPIYKSLASHLHQTSTESVSFATDGGWFQTLGLDCVLFGPGSIEVAHRANEFMPKNEFHRGAELLRDVVREHCA